MSLKYYREQQDFVRTRKEIYSQSRTLKGWSNRSKLKELKVTWQPKRITEVERQLHLEDNF